MIVKNEVVATLLPHPDSIIPIHITFSDLLGPVDKHRSNYQYRKIQNSQLYTDKSEAIRTPTKEEPNLSHVGYQCR